MEDLGFLAVGYIVFKFTAGTYLIRLWRRSRRAKREAIAARQAA
ncbi:MAG: hypothetical protein ACRDKT_10175 [Actinomycetota bacterium]